ncbi:S9 family peptidase [Fimbriimonas ginsengisoli]|uniref:Putative S9 family peptidase n=1 Tax=Fimbriimonas ginsengisoli Gsoil 348 TaxID=661478 RepID=A0A068NRJ2_FIMGI|nr:S9 family peptidase [Fimbriimonas ginsengisoli]AIE84224.1 putative S9 family peptidase [Fimbriimonas ginsengisoli Gsoil 348]
MPKRPIRAEDLLRIVFVGDAQISPDGDRVLFAKKTIDDKNKYITNLFTVDLEGRLTQWTQGEAGAGQGRWSPDGSQIAFVSGRDKPNSQIYLISASGGEARKLTSLPEGSLGEMRWSPDGRMIAFGFREQIPDRTEKAKKEREEKGLSSPPLVTDDVWYRLDGDGYFGMQRYRIYVVEAETGKLVGANGHDWLYDENLYAEFSFDWSPDSKELAVARSASARPMSEPPNTQIWRVDLTGQAWKLEGLPKGEKGSVRWSPDGWWIAYAGDVDENDPWGTRNTKIYVVRADGGEPKDLTGHLDYDMAAGTLSDTKDAGHGAVLEWKPDSTGLYVQVGHHGETQLGFVDVHGGVELLTEGHGHIGIGNVSSDGRRIGAIVGNATRLPEVAVIQAELGTGRLVPKVLTNLNGAFHDEIQLSEPEEVWLDSTDGVKVHAWVMKPIDYLEPRRYPAALQIHGGPHAQYGWAFFHEFQLLAAQGYVVVFSNPRGSKGYGEAFCKAIQGDWGNKDWEDVQTVTRWMQHQPYIHPGQMAVMGGSYGGYMTNWVIGHTDDFRCAISDRCVSNMVSMAGNSDFPFNKNGYFKGVAWGDLDAIKELWRQSPIAYFENVKTPTLIIHSEGDLRCNVEQSEQVFTALQQQGIESRFVRYPSNTSHGMSRSGPPDLRLHRLGEMVSWLDKFLK